MDFHLLFNKIIKDWKGAIKHGIKISNNNTLQVILYADDLAVSTTSEDELQKGAFQLLNNIDRKYNMKIFIARI